MATSDDDLRALIRSVVAELEPGGLEAVPRAAERLGAAGVVARMHEGDVDTPRKVMLWYAGQILDIVETQKWYAMNSILNCVDKFVPAAEAVKP